MTITRTVAHTSANRDYLVVTAQLCENHPMLSDGFSITGALYEARGTWSGEARARNGRDCDMAGMMHDEILTRLPFLKPLVDVHLADQNGVPLHAVANGWYFYSGKARRWEQKYPDGYSNPGNLTDAQRAAQALNIPLDMLPAGLTEDEFTAFADSLRPYWRLQAKTARELLETLPELTLAG